jgi:hypothetical protein
VFVVVTAHDAAYAEMAAITLPPLQRYCATHGYTLVYDGDIDPVVKDAVKAALFRQLYESGQYEGDDVFVWVDSDALPMDTDISLEAVVKQIGLVGETHYVLGYNWDGPNTGVIFARFTSKAAHFIRTADYLARAMGWADQWAINQTRLLEPFCYWYKSVPGRVINSAPYHLYGLEGFAHKDEINDYAPGVSLFVHLPGIEHSERMRLLAHYAALAK